MAILAEYGSYALVAIGFLSSLYLKIRHSPKVKEFLHKFLKFLAAEIILLAIAVLLFNFPLPIVFLGLLLALAVFIMLLVSTFHDELLPVINERTLVVYTVLFWAVYFSGELVRSILSGVVFFFMMPIVGFLLNLFGASLSPGWESIFLVAEVSLILLSAAFLILSLREYIFGRWLGSVAVYWFLFALFAISLSQLLSFVDVVLYSLPSDIFGVVEWFLGSLSLGVVLASFSVLGWSLIAPGRGSIERCFADKYSNDQFRPSELLLVILVVAGSLLLNHYLAVVSIYLLINLWVVFEPYLFRPYLPWGKKITK
jgi:hypothetical protein